jgi:hypothetical protein
MENDTKTTDITEDEDMTLREIIFSHKMALLLCLGLALTGCGRKWEQLWGQDTRPETRYIAMTPDQIEFGIGSLNPAQWADRRFRDARYLSVWACTDANVCTSIPEDRPDGDDMVVYVITEGSIISVYNVKSVYTAATKIRVQVVL